MLKYIIKRVLVFLPTLGIISLLAFVISINSPSDPVERLARSASTEGSVSTESSATGKIKNEIRERLGLNLPIFYLSLQAAADCDTLHRIDAKAERESANALTRQFGNWEEIQAYRISVQEAVEAIYAIPQNSQTLEIKNDLKFRALSLLELTDTTIIAKKIAELNAGALAVFSFDSSGRKSISTATLIVAVKDVTSKFALVKANSSKWLNYVPNIAFNGFNNQYHIWLFGDVLTGKNRGRKGILRGDFGDSFVDSKPVLEIISESFPYSFFLVIFSIVLAYLVSIPLGVYAAYKEGGKFDKVTSILTFMLYSLPSFFVGTWLLYYFANPDHLVWFPTNGVYDPSTFDSNWSLWTKIVHQCPYFVLPVITYTYSLFSFISRIMKASTLDVLGQDYIRTARAKGMSEYEVVVKHAMKNAMLPIVTMFADIFPAAVGGSVILETIFSIPGLGKGIFNSVLATDVPMIVAIFTITGILTVVGYLVSDVIYAAIDPRIKYK